jgi:RNA polymerase sigma-70 factor, ECF subfamily
MNPTPVAPEPESLDDETILRRVLAGETRLFELLMRRHNQRIFRTARAILRDDAEAEDVMQETYVRAYAKLGSFEGRALFSTWLTKIAVYEALARVRHRRHFDLLDPSEELEGELAMTTPSSDRDPEQHMIDQEMSAVVERAIDALPDGFRAVFMLRAVQELSTAEAADCLGIPEETVKTRFHRARGLLQKALFLRAESALPSAFSFHLSRCDRVVAGVMLRIADASGNPDA